MMKTRPRPLTIPLVFLAVYFFVILNTTGFPGAIVGGGPLRSWNSFGWPSEYLITEFSQRQHDQLLLWRQNKDYGFVDSGTITLSSDQALEYFPRLLLLNVAVCLTMVLVGALVVEYWQRFFDHPRQIGLRSLFLFVALAALIVYLPQSDSGMMWYFSAWPLLQPIAVGVFALSILATIVFELHMGTHPLKRHCHKRRMRGAR